MSCISLWHPSLVQMDLFHSSFWIHTIFLMISLWYNKYIQWMWYKLGMCYPTLRGSAGHDEQGRFASVQVGEVPLQWIWNISCLWNIKYMLCILYIYWLKYFDVPTIIFWYVMYMLCIYYTYTDNFFVRGMNQPQVSTLCSWSSNTSACLDRQPIWRGSILLLSTCGSYNRSDEDILLNLVFFSAFDELRLRTTGIMESKGIHRVY